MKEMLKQPLFSQIKCVTLDLDDTLWPIEPTITRAEQALYDWIKLYYPDVAQKYSATEIANKRNLLSKKREDIAHDVTQLRYCALSEIAEEFDYTCEFSEQGLALFRRFRNQVEPYAHSEKVLSYLQKHFTLGAITNGNAQLDKTSLGCYFDFVITAEEMGVSKPHSEMFVKASEHAGVKMDEIVHIGDSPQTDVLGALAAGCKAVWFNQKRLPWPGGQTPDKVVHCLSELPKILKE